MGIHTIIRFGLAEADILDTGVFIILKEDNKYHLCKKDGYSFYYADTKENLIRDYYHNDMSDYTYDEEMNIEKYHLTKLDTNSVLSPCWYEIPINQVKQLFEDERFTGEICHLYNDSENGAESLIQTDEQLGDAIFEAMENHTPFVVHLNDVYAQEEIFEVIDNQ